LGEPTFIYSTIAFCSVIIVRSTIRKYGSNCYQVLTSNFDKGLFTIGKAGKLYEIYYKVHRLAQGEQFKTSLGTTMIHADEKGSVWSTIKTQLM
jgi:hypothetical protein